MRVSLVTESFYPAIDAATGTVRQVADRLVDRGHQVQVVAPGPGLTSYRGAVVSRVRMRERPGGQVRDALQGFGPDLVQVHSPGTLGRKALKHSRRAGTPTVATQLAPVPDVAVGTWLTKVAERADRVLVSADWVREQLFSLGVSSHLWVPGVDLAGFGPQLRDPWLHDRWSRARSRDGRRLVVGYVGSLHRRRGVRALAQLAGVSGVRPVIVGEGPQRAWLSARLPDAHVTGPLEGHELATAMATLDLLVHPGERETCAHAMREAAASGVPVVTTSRGAGPEVVLDGRTGLLYDPAVDGALARAVTRAVRLAETDALVATGARARARAARRGWPAAVDELLDCHHRAVLSRGSARAA